jgi:NADP-dependent 3-hydroxy acid dehydrogenase YdfG
MSSPSHKVAVVTGASSCIGAAIAKRLDDESYTIYGTSRKVKEPQPRSTRITMRALDVRDDKAVRVLVDVVVRNGGRIDLLVNNAGSQLVGATEDTSLEQAKDLFDVNFLDAVRATTAVLPHIRAARSGRIVFIGSVLGFIAGRKPGTLSSRRAVENAKLNKLLAEALLDSDALKGGPRSKAIPPQRSLRCPRSLRFLGRRLCEAFGRTKAMS